jgi:hypothetical protein
LNKHTNNIVAIISDALTSVVEGNDAQAVKHLSNAIRALTGTKTHTTSVSKPTNGRRGPKPSLNVEQVAAMKKRLASGESIVNVAKTLGISTQTAYRHLRLAKTNA